jgi:hypothetical protein
VGGQIIARALLAIPTMLSPSGPARDEPLEVARVDGSTFPTVVVDIVTPLALSAQTISATMVDVDGLPVESVTPVDPGDVVVGLVIDDRPGTESAVVTGLQGAAVELVRNVSEGIRISLGTPSGLRTALTADRGANIARIAGITSGAPAVLPLPDVLSETVAELASSRASDRHAVVVLGAEVAADAARLAPLGAELAESGTTLHLVAPENVTADALARLATRTGGTVRRVPETLAAMDDVTVTISKRYRVTFRLTAAGDHQIRLTVGDERFSARFSVAAAPADPPAPNPTEVGTTIPAAGAAPVGAAPVTAAPTASTSPAPLAVPPRAGGGGLPLRTIGLGVVALAVVVLLGSVVVLLIRRRDREDDLEVVQRPAGPAVPPKPAVSPKPAPAPPLPARSTPAPSPLGPRPGPKRVPPARSTPAPAPLRRRPTPERVPPARRAEVTPLSRRPGPEPPPDGPEWIVAGDVRLSPARGEVWCGDRRVELSPAELGVLELLMTSGGRGVTRDAIVEAGQLDESDGPDAVDAIVAQVRRKTGVRGRGNVVRKERVVTYFLEGAEPEPEG